MASLRCYSFNPIIVPRKSSSKALIRASMDSCSSSESKKASNSVSFTNKVNKVYEDENMGILCYTDENSELICEGLDEGPRLTWQDMEKLSTEKKLMTEEDWRERTLRIAIGMDWSGLQTVVSMGKN